MSNVHSFLKCFPNYSNLPFKLNSPPWYSAKIKLPQCWNWGQVVMQSFIFDPTRPGDATLAICPKLYRNCAFLQNFHSRKLGETTEFYAVDPSTSLSHHFTALSMILRYVCCFPDLRDFLEMEHFLSVYSIFLWFTSLDLIKIAYITAYLVAFKAPPCCQTILSNSWLDIYAEFLLYFLKYWLRHV